MIGLGLANAAALCVQQRQQPRQIDPTEVRRVLSSDDQRLQLEFE